MTLDFCKLEPEHENLIPCRNATVIDMSGFLWCDLSLIDNDGFCNSGECEMYEPTYLYTCNECKEDCEYRGKVVSE